MRKWGAKVVGSSELKWGVRLQELCELFVIGLNWGVPKGKVSSRLGLLDLSGGAG